MRPESYFRRTSKEQLETLYIFISVFIIVRSEDIIMTKLLLVKSTL